MGQKNGATFRCLKPTGRRSEKYIYKKGGHESDEPLFVPPLMYCLNFVSHHCFLKIRLVERAHRIDYGFFLDAEHHANFR